MWSWWQISTLILQAGFVAFMWSWWQISTLILQAGFVAFMWSWWRWRFVTNFT
jgi:hypothetical protein